LDTLIPQYCSKAVNYFPKLGSSQRFLPSLKTVKINHVLLIASYEIKNKNASIPMARDECVIFVVPPNFPQAKNELMALVL
jgi:hypothetical protein